MGGDARDQKSRSAALQRRYGPSPEACEAMFEHNSAVNDWRTVCRHCGEVLDGTIAELKAHDCGKETS